MRRALIEVLLLAVPAGLLGPWVVLRGLAFFTTASGTPPSPRSSSPTWPAGACSAPPGRLARPGAGPLPPGRRPELAEGVAVAIVLSAAVALGAVLVSDISDPGVGANSLLFGSLLAVADADVTRSATCSMAASGDHPGVLAGRRPRRSRSSFDRARAGLGVPLRRPRCVLASFCLSPPAVAVAVSVVGSLILLGLFLVPAATARLMTRRLSGPGPRRGLLASREQQLDRLPGERSSRAPVSPPWPRAPSCWWPRRGPSGRRSRRGGGRWEQASVDSDFQRRQLPLRPWLPSLSPDRPRSRCGGSTSPTDGAPRWRT